MTRHPRRALLLVTSALLLAACGTDAGGGQDQAAPAASQPPAAQVTAAPPPATPGTGPGAPPTTPVASPTVTDKDYRRASFTRSATVDNRWLPLAPGTEFTYEGRITNDEGERVTHQVVFTVTDLTKTIDGVASRVVLDRDYNAGQLVEAEIAFHAQDDAGNVWNMGEYPEEYEDGRFSGAPDVWLSGEAGARAGVLMRADPRTGTPSYLQGWAPRIDFNDTARVKATGVRTCVPVRCYDGVLVTDEWNPDEPDAHQDKYNAPGVGTVRADFAGSKEQEKETLALVRVTHLDAAGTARIRAQALALDRHAYRARGDLYARTAPAS